ncbi:MAG: hypothetical protein LBQ54_15830 [Planctomycetaceae bacterium]|nr:hypothetical protein [Planctomycetaceae bacterium]
MPPAGSGRPLHPCREPRRAVASRHLRCGRLPIENLSNLRPKAYCDGTACSPARVAHWSPSAKQRLQPLARYNATARSLTLTPFGSPSVGEIFPTGGRMERSDDEASARRGFPATAFMS